MKYVAALDVGTTTVRCHIVDENANTVAFSADKVRKNSYIKFLIIINTNTDIFRFNFLTLIIVECYFPNKLNCLSK